MESHLERKMESRHIRMISLGGVIGTGLFLSSGYTIHEAGPIGTIFAYIVGACIVYSVMLCLGELSVAMPCTGAFHVYAKKYIGKHTGFVVAILYWLTWTIALGSEFTAAGLIMRKWFPNSPVWLWSLLLIILIYLVNIFSVRIFAETEFWFAAIKVFAIIAFILLGILAIIGIIPVQGFSHAPGITNLWKNGLFPNGVKGIFTTMLTVNFAFSGTELIAVTAGEAKNPQKTIPEAIHTTLWRLIIFFVGSITVMSALIPYQKAGVTQSPFVYVLTLMKIPYASNLMNFVVLTAIISAANSGLYASSRMLWSLSNEGTIPKWVSKTNRHGVPVIAISLSMIGGILALLSSVFTANTVYLVLVSISGLAVIFVWIAIAIAQINFRRSYIREGNSLSDLPFRTPWYPFTSIFALVTCSVSCVMIWFDPNQRPALIWTIPFIILCYIFSYLQELSRKRKKTLTQEE